jgi:hypothetical protein
VTLALLSFTCALMGKASGGGKDDPACWTTEQWMAWRDNQIRHILEPTFKTKRERLLARDEVIDRSLAAYKFLQPILEKEPDLFSKDPARSKALGHFVDFITAQHWMGLTDSKGNNTHALGLEIPDNSYWKYSSSEVEFPALLGSQAFLKKMASPATYREAVEMIEKQNSTLPDDRKWIVFLFRAQFILSLDQTTFGRMLVLVPDDPAPGGGSIDKWINFAIATPDLRPAPRIRSVSVVAVHRRPDDRGASKSFLVDFMRRKNRATGLIEITPTMLLPNNPSVSCYDCHKVPVLPIRPEAELMFNRAGRLVEKTSGMGVMPEILNQRIRAYGPPDFGVLRPESYGPSLGPANRPRPDQLIKKATRGIALKPESYDRIRSAMNCAACHDRIGKLNFIQAVRSDADLERFKQMPMVETYIKKGWMPPGNDLSRVERRALWRCLMYEYYDPVTRTGLFAEWLKGEIP